MSTGPDNEFDLEKLFLPAWAQTPSSAKSYAQYEGEEDRGARRDDRRGPRFPRRDGGRDDRRGPRRDRPREQREGPRPEGRGRGPAPGPGAPGAPAQRRERFGPPRERREQRPPPPPMVEIAVAFLPDDKGLESLARQIRMTGRAYPLFDIAVMILQKPERHKVSFTVKKDAEGKPLQTLIVCALDDTLWLSEDEAIGHILKRHFATFYQAERTATEPPKGKYTFVAQCGMSGVILGPPNFHDYQDNLRKLHAERYSRMPFEVYKARVRIVRDEEIVKKWTEEQSWKTEYLCLNMPEPLRLLNMDAVEQHFRQNHKDVILKQVEAHTLSGMAARNLRSPELARLVRHFWEEQKRFPLQTATTLSQRFASHGLQFFKVNKTITHVSVARPHYLDLEANPVSEGVRRIVDYINVHAKCTRRNLIEALVPSIPSPTVPPTPVPESPAGAGAALATAPEPAEPNADQTALVADLHWLIHQGHVIEFANGTLEAAKKPIPKPPKPQPRKPVETPAPETPAGQPQAESTASTPEAAAPINVQATVPADTLAPGPTQAETLDIPVATQESPSSPAPVGNALSEVPVEPVVLPTPQESAPAPDKAPLGAA